VDFGDPGRPEIFPGMIAGTRSTHPGIYDLGSGEVDGQIEGHQGSF